MNLRIAWLGPWTARSAIAAFGLEVVSELEERGDNVTIFRSEMGAPLADPPLHGNRQVVELRSTSIRDLQLSYDHVIANIGDHLGFHGAILPVLHELGATIIFHDGYLASLAGAYVEDLGGTANTYEALIRLTYGPDATVSADDIWNTPLETVAAERPMVEWLARLAAGCVTHSSAWVDRLRQACPGPVAAIPLCYPDPKVSPPRPIGDMLTITTLGHVNRNKRADQVICALASDRELASRCRYQLIGEVSGAERDRLSTLAQALETAAPSFLGRLSDADLRTALAETDVIACLRYPILEGGSASLVTALFTARPTLVSHQAHYADIPAGLVLPCAPGNEAPDVAKHLRWILDKPDEAQALGTRARTYAAVTHVKGRYVDKLLELAARATQISPLVRAAARFGQVLGGIGADPNDPFAERIARALTLGLPSM
jgi:hypothetical protein